MWTDGEEEEGQEKMGGLYTNDMLEKEVDDAMTMNRGEWKKMTCIAYPK